MGFLMSPRRCDRVRLGKFSPEKRRCGKFPAPLFWLLAFLGRLLFPKRPGILPEAKGRLKPGRYSWPLLKSDFLFHFVRKHLQYRWLFLRTLLLLVVLAIFSEKVSRIVRGYIFQACFLIMSLDSRKIL